MNVMYFWGSNLGNKQRLILPSIVNAQDLNLQHEY